MGNQSALDKTKALRETPINGGLTDEGPKVAEYLGR